MDELLKSFGVSSKEDNMRSLIKKELQKIKHEEKINIEINEDTMGNLIAKLGEGKEKVMICTHMDNAGVMVTSIESSGFVRISTVGNLKPEKLVRSFVRFENGALGRVDALKDKPSRDDLFIDLGVSDKEAAYKKVKEGDAAEIVGKGFMSDGKMVASNLHSKLGCYTLLQVIRGIKDVKNPNKELYFVFTSQMEAGFRGARAAASEIKPNIAVVLDSLEAEDYIGGNNIIKLDGGPIICIYDNSLVIHNEVKKIIEKAADKLKITLQYSVGNERNEGGLIHKEAGGIKTGMVGLPCRYINTPGEMMSLKDIEDAVNLIGGIAEYICR